MRPSPTTLAFAVTAALVVLLAGPLRRLLPVVRYRVDGPSMEPSFRHGDRLLVNRLAYAARAPAVGDVVVLRDPDDDSRFLIKRIATSPDPDGNVVVLGDNPAASRDSRIFGPVARGNIVGKALLKY